MPTLITRTLMPRGLPRGLFAAFVLMAGSGALPAQAQTYLMPEGPMEPYGMLDEGPVEFDPPATGAIMVMPPQGGPAPGQTWIGYCASRYPTYDQTSNTYWGPDGRQYLCR